MKKFKIIKVSLLHQIRTMKSSKLALSYTLFSTTNIVLPALFQVILISTLLNAKSAHTHPSLI